MNDWTNHPDAEKVLGLAADPRPAWLWSSDGTKRIWRNEAAKFFGARLKSSGIKRADNPQPIKGQVARIIRLGLPGRPSLSRVQFIAGRKPLSATCVCTPLELGEDKPMLLIVGVDPIDEAVLDAAGPNDGIASASDLSSEPVAVPDTVPDGQSVEPSMEAEAAAIVETEPVTAEESTAPSGLAALVEKLAGDERLFEPLGNEDDEPLPEETLPAPGREYVSIAFDETLESGNEDRTSDWGDEDPLAVEEAAFAADRQAEGASSRAGLWQLTGRGLSVTTQSYSEADSPAETAEAEAVERVSRYNFEELSRILTDRVGRLPEGEEPDSADEPKRKKHKGSLVALSDETLVLNRLPLGLLIFRDQDILFVNRAMTDLTGHETTTTLRALGLSAIFPTTDPQDPAGPVSHLMRRDGEKIPVAARLQTITWQGRSAFMLSARASEAITRQQPVTTREKSSDSQPAGVQGLSAAALSRISRELRRPLNTIGGFSELIATEAFGAISNPRYLEYARDIKSASHSIADLADELDDYVRLAEGAVALTPADIALSDLLTECLVRVRGQAGAARVLLRSSISERLPMIRADATTLSQAVLNMLASAIAATEQGGKVVLSAQREDDGAVNVHVRDDTKGPGAMADAFIVFRDGTDRDGEARQPVRSSIGLTLTRSLVAVNACSLRLDPASESGTLMTLTIPAELVVER